MKWPIHLLMFFATVECNSTSSTLHRILNLLAYSTGHDLTHGIRDLGSDPSSRLCVKLCHVSHENLHVLSYARVAFGFVASRAAHNVNIGIGG